MKLFYTNLGSPYLMVALDWPRAACSVGRLGTDPEDVKTIGTIELERERERETASKNENVFWLRSSNERPD
jgi:hypothetical protein